ncbi:MAG: SOS response-associated peptidase [Pseudomonadota bacterium]
MCGRLNVTADPLTQLLMSVFDIPYVGVDNVNAAPTEPIAVVRLDPDTGPRLDALRWWLTPSWSREVSTKYAMFNAKAETLAEKRSFSRPFQRQRCVVPVSGFYEWLRDGGTKVPHFVHAADEPGLLLAGLWDSWTDKSSGEILESFAIVTTAAHGNLGFLHHRQPVLLSADEARRWLDPDAPRDELDRLLGGHLPVGLVVQPVTTTINNARNKTPDAFQPAGAPRAVDPDPKLH